MRTLYISVLLGISILSVNAQSFYQNLFGITSITPFQQSMTSVANDYYHLHYYLDGTLKYELNKLDENGMLLWTKSLSSVNGGLSFGVIQSDGSDLLISGGANFSGIKNFLVKSDTAGNPSWALSINYGDINIPTKIHKSGSGYYHTGYRDFPTGSAYTYDITLSKIDLSGNFIWGKACGDDNFQYSNVASVLTQDGGIITCGTRSIQLQAGSDAVIVKFDSTGVQQWVKIIDPGTFFPEITISDIIALPDSTYIIAAGPFNSNGNHDVVLFKINNNGDVIWSNRYYNIGYGEITQRMILDSNGEVFVTGQYNNLTVPDDEGYFAMKVDTAGNLIATAALIIPFTNFVSYSDHYLAERPGIGYVFNGMYYSGSYWSPVILGTDYFGQVPCNLLNSIYPFTVQPLSWSATSNNLLDEDVNITGATASVNFNNSTASASTDLCTVISVEENKPMMGLSIYPVPCGDILNIAFENGNVQTVQLTLYDITGRKINSIITESAGNPGNSYQIDTRNLLPGSYIISVSTEYGTESVKFIK